jgi:tRNA(adenine34) deaminase
VDAPDERVMRLASRRRAGGGGGRRARRWARWSSGATRSSEGRQRREREQDQTAHAEILALRAASKALGSWHLEGCAMVVTLEPCAMCAGAIVLARIDRLVYGASDPKAGFAGSLGDLVRDGRLNHEVDVTVGVLADECGELLRAFFAERR